MTDLNLNQKNVELKNYTPHEVNIMGQNEEEIILSIEPEGEFPRLEEHSKEKGELGGIPIKEVSYGKVQNLPEPKEGVLYIVSTLTAMGSNRNDLLVPYDLVRDEKNRIVGARSLARVK